MSSFGGNGLKSVDATGGARHVFAEDEYTYCLHFNQGGEAILPALESYCVFFLRDETGTGARVSGSGDVLREGDALLVEKAPDLVITPGGAGKLLIAGIGRSQAQRRNVTHLSSAQLKKVTKPWGHEIWINGENADFALKQIWIRKGHRTSLQYHRLKRETNLLLEGSARLHFKQNESVSNDAAIAADLGSVELAPMTVLDVFPNTLHRIEALTDLLLYEVSTPHLDDVVRIQDDTQRGDGRILSEHMEKK